MVVHVHMVHTEYISWNLLELLEKLQPFIVCVQYNDVSSVNSVPIYTTLSF